MKFFATPWWQPDFWRKRLCRMRIRQFVRGCANVELIEPPILDVGAGYRDNSPEIQMGPYDTLDSNADLNPTFCTDIIGMEDVVPAGRYRAIVCTEVLEHVAWPLDALKSMLCVLQPGGTLVMTVPFWFGIHEKPYQPDYWRFTPRAMLMLLYEAGFREDRLTVRTVGWRRTRPSNLFVVAHKPEN